MQLFGVSSIVIKNVIHGYTSYCRMNGLENIEEKPLTHRLSKISEAEAIKIKMEYANGKTQKELSKKYNVCEGTISRVLHNDKYRFKNECENTYDTI